MWCTVCSSDNISNTLNENMGHTMIRLGIPLIILWISKQKYKIWLHLENVNSLMLSMKCLSISISMAMVYCLLEYNKIHKEKWKEKQYIKTCYAQCRYYVNWSLLTASFPFQNFVAKCKYFASLYNYLLLTRSNITSFKTLGVWK